MEKLLNWFHKKLVEYHNWKLLRRMRRDLQRSIKVV